MNAKIQLFLAVATAVTGSFLQEPSNHFQLTFNSTFLNGNERLFSPIIIPNATKTERPHAAKPEHDAHRTKANELILQKILPSEESTPRDNYLDEEPKAAKFSSRYSTKQGDSSEKAEQEENENSRSDSGTTQIPNSLEANEDSRKADDTPTTEVHESFISLSDDGEEEKEDAKGIREAEELDASPTTNEPFAELQRPTSYLNPDEDFENYETASSAEETDSSEEEKEDKRSLGDYYNSGSKNYHSIQTPLNRIQYKGPHTFDDDFEPEKTRTRLVGPVRRRPISHNWPYSRSQLKEEVDKLNEISESDEKALSEGLEEEVNTKPKHSDLELAVEKDESKFDRNKKYNYVEERNRRKQQQKQQQKALNAEEEKDERRPPFSGLKQYQVDEEQPKHHPKGTTTPKFTEGIWSTNPPYITTLKNTFKASKSPSQKKLTVSGDVQSRQFLGPVVFSQNPEEPKPKPVHPQKQAHRAALRGLLKSEKLDQDKLTNEKFEKSTFGTGSKISQTFNHIEESNEMYNAILANIQSVFGLRSRPLKSGTGSQKGGSSPEASLGETRLVTWSLPLEKPN